MPKKWRNHWGSIPAAEGRDRDQALLKIGNLSLLSSSLNSAIRDAAWEKKKSGVGARHGLSHYAAGLETLGEYLKLDVWDEDAIQARGEWLAEQAVGVWPSPNAAG